MWSISQNFSEEFDKALNNDEYYKNNSVVVGSIPKLYSKYGFDTDKPLTITPKHLKDITHEKVDGVKKYHVLTKQNIINAVKQLSSPALVIESPSNKDVLIAFTTETDTNGNPIAVYITKNGRAYINSIETGVNHILSIYGRDNTINFINSAIEDNRVKDGNKNRANELQNILGIMLSLPDNILSIDSKYSISNNSENVNQNISTNNTKSEYSVPREVDREYLELAKDPEKNEARLRELVDDAAKTNGYTDRMYHGSKKSADITVFKDWQYFTHNKKYAERYADKKLYGVYVQIKNLFDTRKADAENLFKEAQQEYGLSNLNENGLPDWTDGYDISEYIDENNLDYDGIILDEGGDLVNGKPVMRGNSYVVRKSAQVKSADLVTYDDNGNIIPLSERFNSGNEDIRYSVPRVDNNSEDDVKYSINNEVKSNGTNSEVLGKAENVQRKSQSQNDVRKRSGYSENLRSYMGSNGIRIKDGQELSASSTGWCNERIREKFSFNRFYKFIDGIRGNIQRRQILGVDAVGRQINDTIQDKFAKTVFSDKDGKIFSLYHWTNEKFDKFEKGEFGFHFGTMRAAYDISHKSGVNSANGIYKEVYLNITNPFYCDQDAGVWCPYMVAYYMRNQNLVNEIFCEHIEQMDGAYDGTYDSRAAKEVRGYLKQLGYDGIVYQNTQEDMGSFSAIAFDSDQILTVAENGILKENTGVTEASSTEDAFSMPENEYSTARDEFLRYAPEKYAHWLLHKYGAPQGEANTNDVAEKLTEIVKLYNKGGENAVKAETQLQLLSMEIAESIPDVLTDDAKEKIEYIKGLTVKLTDMQKSEI